MLHRAFEVFISSNGRKLDEYDVKIDDAHTVTCFIPSEANKSFAVCFKSYFEGASASVRCVIDGRKMGASLCSAGSNGHRWGVRTSLELRQPFQFSELSLTEDENIMINNTIMDNLGCIDISVFRVQKVGKNHPTFKSTEVTDIGAVNEKMKKAGSHCVSLGEPRRCVAHRRTDSAPFIPGEGCWVKFRFRYRPRAILQAQGLITLSGSQHRESDAGPSTSRSTHKDKSGSHKRRSSALSSDVEVKSRVGDLDRLAQTHSQQASGLSDMSESPAKRVKRERRHVPHSRQEVIDLSADTKRERSPIHLTEAHVGQVIDLTQEED